MGNNVELNFDIYSMLFVTTFHPEYVYDLKKKKEEREEIIKRILDPTYEIKKEKAPERFLEIQREIREEKEQMAKVKRKNINSVMTE